MNILVINAGSSSLKYQLIDIQEKKVLAKGIADRIGYENSSILHTSIGKAKNKFEKKLGDHRQAIASVFGILTDRKYGVIEDLSNINAVGHRIVHGGEEFSESVKIDDDVIAAIKENIELAPLHNPANLMGISACRELVPDAPMVASV